MFLLGFIKFFVYIIIVVGAVATISKARHWYRRIVIIAPIVFLTFMLTERLFSM